MSRREFAAPTPAQLGYARRIAAHLGLDVSTEIWESKVLLSEFIGTHRDAYEEGKEGKTATGPRRIE